MPDFLEKILRYKCDELASLKRRVTLKDVRLRAEDAGPARDFLGALQVPGVRIVAEIKKASPSAGVIRADFEPVGLARGFEDSGAAALSVLTDEHFFQGSLRHLEEVRRRVKIPVLRKDFTFDEYQIYEARGAGADAILLIVRILEDGQLKDYAALAGELGMATLVEVHEEREVERAVRAGARLIGINNRDLESFETDLNTTIRLKEIIPPGVTVISESGIHSRADILKLREIGVNVFLVGEALLHHAVPSEKLCELLR